MCEPITEYRTNKWNYENILPNYNDQFVDIEEGFALFHQPTIISKRIIKASRTNNSEKIKLSSLRGKHSIQTKEEIDKQLKALRDEWERDI